MSIHYAERYVEAILEELQERVSELKGELVHSLYFGGGTPTVLSLEQLQRIASFIKTNYNLAEEVEFTMEANPDDLSEAYLKGIYSIGVNRLSVGIQSFRDDDLKLMRRSHNTEQALACVSMAQRVGITNISIDLIYGIPGLSLEAWEENLKIALGLEIRHVSAYHLTFEEGTVFGHWLKQGRIKELTDELSVQQFLLLRKYLIEAGFDHYEISNFAFPGFMSRHNRAYWEGVKYAGFGPAAHSYNGVERRWNVSSLKKYIGIENCKELFEKEVLTKEERYLEYVMVSLRRREGIDLRYLGKQFGEGKVASIVENSRQFIATEEMELTEGCLKVKPESWLKGDWYTRKLG